MLTPNYDCKLFKIEITVFENGQTMDVIPETGKREPSYQAIIGALDIMKTTTIFSQSGVNAEKYHEWRKKQSKKKATEGKREGGGGS